MPVKVFAEAVARVVECPRCKAGRGVECFGVGPGCVHEERVIAHLRLKDRDGALSDASAAELRAAVRVGIAALCSVLEADSFETCQSVAQAGLRDMLRADARGSGASESQTLTLHDPNS